MIWIAVHLLHLNEDCDGNNWNSGGRHTNMNIRCQQMRTAGWKGGGGRGAALRGGCVHLRSIKLSLATSINSIYSNFLLLILNIRFVHFVCTRPLRKACVHKQGHICDLFCPSNTVAAYNFICNIVFYEPIKALALFGGRSFWKFRKELLMSSYLFRCAHLYAFVYKPPYWLPDGEKPWQCSVAQRSVEYEAFYVGRNYRSLFARLILHAEHTRLFYYSDGVKKTCRKWMGRVVHVYNCTHIRFSELWLAACWISNVHWGISLVWKCFRLLAALISMKSTQSRTSASHVQATTRAHILGSRITFNGFHRVTLVSYGLYHFYVTIAPSTDFAYINSDEYLKFSCLRCALCVCPRVRVCVCD